MLMQRYSCGSRKIPSNTLGLHHYLLVVPNSVAVVAVDVAALVAFDAVDVTDRNPDDQSWLLSSGRCSACHGAAAHP